LSHCIHLVLNSHASTRFISTLSLHDALPIFARSYDESIRESRKTIEMDPGFALAHNQLGEAYLQKHMHHEAVDELQKAVQLSGRSEEHTSELQSLAYLVCRLLLEKKNLEVIL